MTLRNCILAAVFAAAMTCRFSEGAGTAQPKIDKTKLQSMTQLPALSRDFRELWFI